MDQISRAAHAAGQWWADRLDAAHSDKREAFSEAVAYRVEQALRGQAAWNYFGVESKPSEPPKSVYTECDYDPLGLLLIAVRDAVDPNCRGMMFSADGLLPQKHGLCVFPHMLRPKEGYEIIKPTFRSQLIDTRSSRHAGQDHA